MTIREELEAREREYLSPYAVCSADTRGRERDLQPCPLRTEFQRDRDRILHCKSFRRLKFKTQVFIAPEGDHFRTRLTHTLEVSQVARTLARALRLNEDLTEAIALGHDLGHTPFGHSGERSLDRLTSGGFRHNEQSLRVVEVLEGSEGLNLTWEVRDGILKHSGKLKPETLEGECVARADRIAYINHDIDDAIRAGVLRDFELPQDLLRVLGETHGQRIDTMITDIVRESMGQPHLSMSAPVQQASDELRSFLFDHVYLDEWRQSEEEKCDHVIVSLFEYFMEHPGKMPLEYVQISYRDGTERAVTDFLACMSDRYAIRTYQNLFIPVSFPVI
ncbi:MAG: deoxyguanosinetriphosphate triphosphohydrolase [Clostridia bacterium]|jgi:dGTPase|nr:deoxyguanosinetriphosphate triphosphohydrolase [Clostridia bacterium]